MNMDFCCVRSARLLRQSALISAVLALCAAVAQAAVPGITGTLTGVGPTTQYQFDLDASAGRVTQPDGISLYAWGYGCNSAPAGYTPAAFATVGFCGAMQVPGPTLVVTEGQTVAVKLTNKLPVAAGATSLVFPGMKVTAGGGQAGLLAQEACANTSVPPAAAPACNSVTYTFTATHPGTFSFHSGTRPDLQVEMGLYGALIVLPATAAPVSCKVGPYSLAAAAYDHPGSCYDREYLFQFGEMNLDIHNQVEAQAAGAGPIAVKTDPNWPSYFLINGRSMPDLMDNHYAASYPNQPYNGNPHMHPGEVVLMRVIGQGRLQHPFHFHGNHARVLARDGNLLQSATNANALAGPLLFTIATVPGQTEDALFAWTGEGLNWDVYSATVAHTCNSMTLAQGGSPGFDPITHEYCPDHGKSLTRVVTPADPAIVADGLWYAGTPYLGLQQNSGNPLPPGQTKLNTEGGYAYMWHSHNEREITTSNVFPGGMLMMLLIDPMSYSIDETQ
jgi:FtsP/CotA-like multicopper oxidase with cupredoxin domain